MCHNLIFRPPTHINLNVFRILKSALFNGLSLIDIHSSNKYFLIPHQALCILANVADGDSAKDYIMGNEDMLKKLMNYMVGGQL